MKQQKKTYYYHPLVENTAAMGKQSTNRYTFAGMLRTEDTLTVAWTRCSNSDFFCKQKGRSISRRRCHQGTENIQFQWEDSIATPNKEFVNICNALIEEWGYKLVRKNEKVLN